MTALQWVIGCGCITLQTLFHLLRLLERLLGSPILIRLMYAKTQLVSQIYQWHMCWASPWKKTKGFSYIHQQVFATYVEIKQKSSIEMCLEMWWLLWRMSARYAGPGKVWVWKDSCLRAVKNRRGRRAKASFYKVSWKRHHTYKIPRVWRKRQIDKGMMQMVYILGIQVL